MVRLLHSADWHLGRPFFGTSLLEDQAHVLEQLVQIAKAEKVDACLIAGDIFDRAQPPAEAVALLDHILSSLVVDLGIPVLLIAGNHDSPERIHFGKRLLQAKGLNVAGCLELPLTPLVLEDRHGPVKIWPIPFADPALVREKTKDEAIRQTDQAFAAILPKRTRMDRQVILTHAFVGGGLASESERPILVGGSELVGSARFRGYSYVALGHLHRPQFVGRSKKIRYSGSILAYSFSESEQSDRGLSIVEIDAKGSCQVQAIPLSPRRPLKVLSGTLEELLEQGRESPSQALVLARLKDQGPVLHAAEQLRRFYPDLLHIERDTPLEKEGLPPLEPFKMDDTQLFGTFFKQVTNTPLDKGEEDFVRSVLASLGKGEEECP